MRSWEDKFFNIEARFIDIGFPMELSQSSRTIEARSFTWDRLKDRTTILQRAS